ncbi:MAG: (Fe-S)-binding protein [Planctomycetia bacterium]|nr:(Fe-S)-binding protein [Planctomycetia bacterium]
MQFTEKSQKTIDACRFCWMCRHICPIGNATGMERNTARARALGLSMVYRGVEKIEESIDNVYECSLCGACTKECKTGWDPILFTTEAKLNAAMSGAMPSYIEKLVENVEKTGNIFGKESYCGKLTEKIAALPQDADVLLFVGKNQLYTGCCQVRAAMDVLEKAGVSFAILSDEPSSGWDLFFLVGSAEETRQTMKACAVAVNGFKTVVALDPNDARMFLRQYKEWGIGLEAPIVTFTAFVADLISSGKLMPKKSEKSYTFQDPASLARDLEEVAPARAIISACGENLEMLEHGKDTNLAGNLIMAQYMPEVIQKVAARRWEEAIRMGVKTVVTANPDDYAALKETQPEGMELVSIQEMVLASL